MKKVRLTILVDDEDNARVWANRIENVFDGLVVYSVVDEGVAKSVVSGSRGIAQHNALVALNRSRREWRARKAILLLEGVLGQGDRIKIASVVVDGKTVYPVENDVIFLGDLLADVGTKSLQPDLWPDDGV